MGDFNCKKVNCEEFETKKSENSWGAKLLDLAENNLNQWVREETRYRGNNQPAKLDLKGINIDDVKHKCPLGKSDHEMLQVEINSNCVEVLDEKHKAKRRNYFKVRYEELKTFFRNMNWAVIKEAKSVQEKYNCFLEIYNEGVRGYVPYYEIKKKATKNGFTRNVGMLKKVRDKAWNNY